MGCQREIYGITAGEEEQWYKSIILCVRDGTSDHWLMELTWEKGYSPHFGIRLDQTQVELMKSSCYQNALNHYSPWGLDYSYRLPVRWLVLSVHANWNLLIFTATSIEFWMDKKLTWQWMVPGGLQLQFHLSSPLFLLPFVSLHCRFRGEFLCGSVWVHTCVCNTLRSQYNGNIN